MQDNSDRENQRNKIKQIVHQRNKNRRKKHKKMTIKEMISEEIKERLHRQKKLFLEAESAGDTFSLGRSLGEAAEPGEVYTLTGDLGVGKTVFTQGFAAGLGLKEPVNSPTFTIVQIYEEGRLPLYHFDVYRIGDVEEMEEIGYEDCFYGQGVSVIEWADLIEEILPEHYIRVVIEKTPEKGFDYRRITLEEI